MSSFLDFVASFRLWADAVGLALLPLGFGLALWYWLRAEMKETHALKDKMTQERKSLEDFLRRRGS